MKCSMLAKSQTKRHGLSGKRLELGFRTKFRDVARGVGGALTGEDGL